MASGSRARRFARADWQSGEWSRAATTFEARLPTAVTASHVRQPKSGEKVLAAMGQRAAWRGSRRDFAPGPRLPRSEGCRGPEVPDHDRPGATTFKTATTATTTSPPRQPAAATTSSPRWAQRAAWRGSRRDFAPGARLRRSKGCRGPKVPDHDRPGATTFKTATTATTTSPPRQPAAATTSSPRWAQRAAWRGSRRDFAPGARLPRSEGCRGPKVPDRDSARPRPEGSVARGVTERFVVKEAW